MKHIIYCFWTGSNPLTPNRVHSLQQLHSVSQCDVILVTPATLSNYILPEHPLHPAYPYISETHKADYLRTYFMHFWGGGYSDIKQTTGSWIEAFQALEVSDAWICGYKEVKGGVAYGPAIHEWASLIGNGAYIAKPQTPLTSAWYSSMIAFLDTKLELLKAHPAQTYRDCAETGSGYPIEWNEMLGRIFHRVCYEHTDKLLNCLPISIFNNYL